MGDIYFLVNESESEFLLHWTTITTTRATIVRNILSKIAEKLNEQQN